MIEDAQQTEEMGGRRRFLSGLAVVFLILMAISLVEAWPQLPDELPMQFDSNGTPSRSGSRIELVIMVLIVTLATLPMLAGGLWVNWMRRHPRWINMPRKTEILSLPPERQAPYWELTAEFMAAMAAAMSLMFLLMIRGILSLITLSPPNLPAWAVWPGVAAIVLVMLIYLPRLITLPRRLIERNGASGRSG
ncbi:MAG: DUF1648 domain-containing protein [Candidatus Aminicenantes bacterium]|nr:DUF1648 domain-containing protein [Candidatus Aminicenantes bacterium]